jgi:hypothetical protein
MNKFLFVSFSVSISTVPTSLVSLQIFIRFPCFLLPFDLYMLGVRLVGGPNRFTGRVEILVNGHYHAVCGDGWDNVDAEVLCGQLGYSTGQASSGYKWGYRRKDYVVRQIGCRGTEKYIQDCSRYNVGRSYRGGYCPNYRYAEVKCNPGEPPLKSP